MSKTPAVIFDIDDTLADWQSARADGATYFASVANGTLAAKVEMVALAHEYLAQGVTVIALTARPALLHDATVEWVASHVSPSVEVIMTTDSKRRKDHETKALLLDQLNGYNVIAAYDDKVENVEMFSAHGITAHLV